MSFPGLISIIQRSTKAKMKRKTYVSPGVHYHHQVNSNSTTTSTITNDDNDPTFLMMNKEPLSLSDQAVELMAYMKGNNYDVINRTRTTITFGGVVPRSLSQAFFLTFCTLLGLLSLALVLQIQWTQSVTSTTTTTTTTTTEDASFGGINFFYLALLSPYAGVYYWQAGDRTDTIQIQLSTNEEESMNEMIVYGPEDEMERMWRTLSLQEKDMIPVASILPVSSSSSSSSSS